jgi:ATP-dependent DNA helicase RecG
LISTIDENYSKHLIEKKDLPLTRVVLLDRVQKKLTITDDAAAILKKEGLIEVQKPNCYVAASVAEVTDDKAAYIKNKAFDKQYYKHYKEFCYVIEIQYSALRKDRRLPP